VFIKGNLAENTALLKNNPGYIGSVASTGGKMSHMLIEGNWNVDMEDDSEAPIPSYKAREIELADPQINGDRWITADLADTGKDNFVALVWDGFHIIDIVVLGHSTPQQNANTLQILADRYNIPDTHIIFDGNNGAYINDYIPDAIPFISPLLTRSLTFWSIAINLALFSSKVISWINSSLLISFFLLCLTFSSSLKLLAIYIFKKSIFLLASYFLILSSSASLSKIDL
jgi:hypothetical protein